MTETENPNSAAKPETKKKQLAVLLRVSNNWQQPDDFHMLSRIGEFVSGKCDSDALKNLIKNPEVISHETDRSSGRLR